MSIVVPVYNAQLYLKKCIESLINQTLKDIEIILVNDGSSDNSLSICFDYAKMDKRIVVIDKLNGGVSSARNTGIQVARGEYIGFVDADDWVEAEMYEAMYYQMQNDQSDVCLCNFAEEKNGVIEKIPLDIPINKNVLVKSEIINYIILNMIGPENADSNSKTIMGSVCRLLIKKDFLTKNNISFPIEIPIMEDLIFCVDLFLKTEKISLNKGFYYHYIHHVNSAVRSYYKNFDKLQRDVFNYIESKLLNYHDIYEMAKNRLNLRYINICISSIVNELHRDNKTSIIRKFQKIKQICSDPKLQDIIKFINIKGYTLRKKSILLSIKKGFNIYAFLCYYIYVKLIEIKALKGKVFIKGFNNYGSRTT